jgi:preprotein translocase subunit YajC
MVFLSPPHPFTPSPFHDKEGASLKSLVMILAQPTPTTAATQGTKVDPGPWGILSSPMFPILLGVLVLLIFMNKSKKGEERKRQDMLKLLKKGDEIQTIGGIIGKVIEAREDRVLVKVDETANAKIWFSRNAIHRVLEEEKAESKA